MNPSALVERFLLPFTVAGLVAGGALQLLGQAQVGDWIWMGVTIVVAINLAIEILLGLLRKEAGVDLIALFAIAGVLITGELLAGIVIAVMLATGGWLESYAAGRAQKELSALLSRAPRVVHRYENGQLTSPPLESVQAGNRLLVKPGEVVPVDGVVTGATAVLDESALTGEARPVTHEEGTQVSSGTVNAGGPFDLHAIASAEASTYAGIVRLVEQAQGSKAPFVRLADRYALIFIPVTLAIAGIAWLISGDPHRAIAVFVVASPCPLILAAPIAIVSGISRAARRGIIVKGGGALETLARAKVLLFDKTGTLTMGMPRLSDIESRDGVDPEELLRLAASLDQVSPHVLASAIVRGAHDRGLTLSFPTEVNEKAGAGIEGVVDGRRVAVGNADWAAGEGILPDWARDMRRRAAWEGHTNVFIRIDGQLAGALVLDDPIRPDTPRAIRSLRRAGIARIVMVTGDHPIVAETVGTAIGVDGILAERTPAEKVEAVKAEKAEAAPQGATIMVGDGINDAPALAAADVGVAMGARGATASSEAADVVLVVDRLDRLAEAVRISRRARRIALESIAIGMGLSLAAMIVAAFGFLPIVAGAILQEAIDVVAILNALRVLTNDSTMKKVPGWGQTGPGLEAAHREMMPCIGRLRTTADRLDVLPATEAFAELNTIRRFLDDELVPHERHEDETVYPILAKALGGEDPTGPLSRTHREIFHFVRLYDSLMDELPEAGPGPDDLRDLRRVLYGLSAILQLHFAQEEELYHALADEEATSAASTERPEKRAAA